MRDRLSSLAMVVFVTALMAGCSSSSDGGVQEIVVESTPEVGSNETAPAEPPKPPKKGQRGHLAGFVVDDSLRPIEGATVTLPGIDLTDISDRDGSFAFADLFPGPYLLRANYSEHMGLEAMVNIKSDEFTRVKVILKRIPPPEPYHETFKFAGFAGVSGHSFGPRLFTSNSAANIIDLDLELKALVIEAVMEPYAGAVAGVAGTNSFEYEVSPPQCCSRYYSGSLPNPMRVVLDDTFLPTNITEVEVYVWPEAFPTPEFNKDYEVFVTAFYREPPPANWSFFDEEDGG